jgi:hypothetical protein
MGCGRCGSQVAGVSRRDRGVAEIHQVFVVGDELAGGGAGFLGGGFGEPGRDGLAPDSDPALRMVGLTGPARSRRIRSLSPGALIRPGGSADPMR